MLKACASNSCMCPASKVNIIGEQAERIYIALSHDRLATMGLAPQDIFNALNSQNVLTPAGSIETQGAQIFIRLDGAFDTLQKIRDTPLVAQGKTLRLSDVATVERGYEDPPTLQIRNQREPALLLGIVMREGWNGLALGKALDAETAKINENLPLGMTLTKVTDQSVNIRSSVDEFMIKFFVALLVVMVVCFVSMGWRVGVVVAAAVPLTLAVVFVVMEAAGINFDRVTLGSLILALGLLVDDAIIAIEMMVVKMEEGYDRIKASAYAEPYRRPHAGRYPRDGDWLYAKRVRPVDRRGIHQQYVLDCRHRPDCLGWLRWCSRPILALRSCQISPKSKGPCRHL